MLISEIKQKFKGTIFEGCLQVEAGLPWLRYDIDDCGPKEQWDEYIDVVNGLKELGLELVDPYVEHDCISGGLKSGQS